MNTLSFNIIPSPTSNDHQVRIVVDGRDLLGSDALGLDPPFFFRQQNLLQSGELLIGRCTCGTEGCSDETLMVKLKEDKIDWDNKNFQFEFDASAYRETIETTRNDHGWEDANRSAERLVDGVFKNLQTADGFVFYWVSARIKPNTIILSWKKDYNEQKLHEFPWDGHNSETAVRAAKLFLSTIATSDK